MAGGMSEDMWTDRPLGDILDDTTGMYPDREAIVFRDQRITYRQFQERVNTLAKGLMRRGVKKGDKVALWMSNQPEWLYTKFAIAKIGAVMVAINTWYRPYELEYILTQSDTTAIVMMDRFLTNDFVGMLSELCPGLGGSEPGKLDSEKFPMLQTIICHSDRTYDGVFDLKEIMTSGEAVPDGHLEKVQRSVAAGDVANLLYTSGTTAFPKGVQLSHINIGRNGFNIGNRLNFTEKDRLWLSLPLFFSFACVNATLTTITHGGCIVLQESFDPGEALRLIDREHCTVYYAMPNMSLMLLDHPDIRKTNTKSLRTGVTIGSSEIMTRVIEELGPGELNNAYGLTETAAVSTITSCNDPLDIRLHQVGKPLPGVEIKITDPATGTDLSIGDEGEICIRGYNVTRGYYKKPQETSEAIDREGWFHTGDLGVLDEDGFLGFRGRIKDMLKSGGINISTLEVEAFLHRHPKVSEAHVVGVPDRIKDEVGLAFVALKEGETCTEKEIIDFCKGQIASFKIPRYVLFGEDFPRTATGKVQKYKLKEVAVKALEKTS
ncbi:AMP-binding protein [Thermodesulfobacteriota bacterium]